jgi:acetolactate synthase I/II/III large subunit
MIRPSLAMMTLSSLISPETHVYVDIGNCMAWAIHHLAREQPGRWHVNLIFGCMGHALPAAIGGCLAGTAPVLAIAGDAAFAMSAFELHTAVEERLPLVVLVLNDGGHGMVEMGSECQFGPGAVPSARFRQRIAAADFARSVGAHACLADSVETLASAFASTVGRSGPSLIDIEIDPSEVPPFGARMELLKRNFSAHG